MASEKIHFTSEPARSTQDKSSTSNYPSNKAITDYVAENGGKIDKVVIAGEEKSINPTDKSISHSFDSQLSSTSENAPQNKVVKRAIDNVAEIAAGKTATHVLSYAANSAFNSSADTITLAVSGAITEITGTTVNLSSLKIGDLVLVTELNVPDRWVGAKDDTNIVLYKSETAKVDLTSYVQKTRTIAGIDLNDDITKAELQGALEDQNHKFVSDTEKAAYSAKADIGISVITNEDVRITNLNTGVYKIIASGNEFLYFNGSQTGTTSSVRIGIPEGETILIVDKYLTTGYVETQLETFTNWKWRFLSDNDVLYFGETTTDNGTYKSITLDNILERSYIKNSLDYSSNNSAYVLSAYQGYLLKTLIENNKVVEYAFTIDDSRWSSLTNGYYTLTIPSTRKAFACYNTAGDQVMAGLSSNGTNIYVITDTKFSGKVSAY